MMLLPSGRTNSDDSTLQSATTSVVQQQFIARTTASQLNVSGSRSGNCDANDRENEYSLSKLQAVAPVPTAAAAATAYTVAGAHKTMPPPTQLTVTKPTATAFSLPTSPGSPGNRNAAGIAIGSIERITVNQPFLGSAGNWEEIDRHLETIQKKLKEGWSVHVGKDGRLYYCNHITQTAGWLPSSEDWSQNEELPYGWERAIDSKGRSYFINHLNKTSTYEAPESVRWDENPPEPRVVVLQRSAALGFGFVAGSEKPVIVRFVTDGGPSMHRLQPGDQILAVNGENVKEAPRDHVIQLVRACESQVTLLVCQPAHILAPGRKSTLLSAGKRAKLRTRPSRVRFAESVCVNGAPLFPPSAFSLGDICVPPMANVLKVFLENGQTKSFKYDTTTTVQDVVTSLLDKLCLSNGEIFSLVLEHVKSLKRNKLTILDPEESLARIAARPGAHKLRCLFRVSFVPISAADLAQKDLNALDYLYMQCCNDVTQERFAPELQPEVALRLAALHMHQHALANNVSPAKLNVKLVEREFGLERFVPISLFDGMKRKELRRLVSHFLKLNAEMTGSSTKVLTQLQAKLHYLDIIAGLPSYGAKCFSTNQREGVERVLLVSPRFGLSQISSVRNSVPQSISAIEDFSHIIVNREDDVTCSVTIFMRGERAVKFAMEDRDACEFSLVLAGYYRLLAGKELPVEREREQFDEDNAPSYLAQHTVLPAAWSYLLPFHNRAHSINFLMPPPYHPRKPGEQPVSVAQAASASQNGECDRNMNSANVLNSNYQPTTKMSYVSTTAMDLDIHSVMATELLEEAKDSGLSDSSGGGGSNYCERTLISNSNNSAYIEAKNEEVLRRVQEMQKMVENSEQYLNEQGEALQEYEPHRGLCGKNSFNSYSSAGINSNNQLVSYGSGVIDFDSDCDSLSSSKVSSMEDTPQLGALKHSDSLVLLAETINQDLSGITKSLNSIEGTQREQAKPRLSLSAASSPRPVRKLNGLGQLLSNLQALSADLSQSESDSESVNSPTNSPTMRRPTLLSSEERLARKQQAAYRSSFGLHSPDGNNFGVETKDYNLREYLKQLKEISDVNHIDQSTGMAAKKLSEMYGFEVREDTFIETDSDLIDLRAIPPPQTPDELDALSLVHTVPQGFGDRTNKRIAQPSLVSDLDVDLDKFLEKVVVAPPTQKATPSKELTPEEIMSFIIPPPPKLDEIDKTKMSTQFQDFPEQPREETENLYSNSMLEKRQFFGHASTNDKQYIRNPPPQATQASHVIEYATVERKSKFSCCPKSKKDETFEASTLQPEVSMNLRLPPRSPDAGKPPPARPPKSAELIQRYSPKKQPHSITGLNASVAKASNTIAVNAKEEGRPPNLPPRVGTQYNSQCCVSPAVSVAPPVKPPLPPISSRPMLRTPIPLPQSNHNTREMSAAPTPPTKPNKPHSNGHCHASNGDCSPVICLQSPVVVEPRNNPLQLLCSPQMARKTYNNNPRPNPMQVPTASHVVVKPHLPNTAAGGEKLIVRNGHVIDGAVLLAKTDAAMAGLLVKLDHIAAQCSAAQAAGGGANIDEDKFQRARNELTEQTLVLVTASKFLVVAMSDQTLSTLPEHLTSCLTAIRRITELTQDMTRHTSAPLQTRNIVLKVHDVTSSFRELVGVEIGPLAAGQLALQAECLANVLATLLRSLRVFSP